MATISHAMAATELAQAADFTPSGGPNLIDRMERAGYVPRAAGPKDLLCRPIRILGGGRTDSANDGHSSAPGPCAGFVRTTARNRSR
jgi:hypothetical protein